MERINKNKMTNMISQERFSYLLKHIAICKTFTICMGS